MAQMEDSYILTLLETKSDKAVDALSKAYGKLLYSLAYRITGSKEDAEEVVSDALLEVWNTPVKYINMSLMSFACLIVRHRAIDKVRSSASQRRKSTYFEVQQELFADFNENAVVDSMVISRVTQEFLLSLSAEDRYIFMRRYFEYAEYSEICRELHMKNSTVRSRLFRMKEEFRKRLENAGITV